ncbi:PAS domain-containing protein [Salibacterium salarium]|uniref:PAS domain-containing protein n=1 Tax=Salibacterium salarium TaxID=284579 RepID=A0A3R9Q587_9BACI|nr:sigma 54-interacting transcriptional regulator [Salibacterium salarium]RSL33912.1 PAS domain-containing protein [Salibacterium salarium]
MTMEQKNSSYLCWLENIIMAINDGVLVIDTDGIVQLINQEYTKITGVKEETILGKYLRDVRKGAVLLETLKDGEKRNGIYRKEGTREYVVDMAPIYQDGEIVGAVSVCKSLNEVHVLTRELESSKQKIAKLKSTVEDIYKAKYTFDDIVGKDGALQETVNRSKKAANSTMNILIQGESGTGKELFAHSIHQESLRYGSPFVPVNCSAIPVNLMESELFGYEEGAFTNSKSGGKIGLFELADKGTIFLDEIGELPMELQVKLLRVIQEGSIRKIGGLKEKEIDVRVISATNKNLSNIVEKGRFREDLFYRLNGIQITVPPLRKRKEDLPLLIEQLTHTFSPGNASVFSEEVKEFFAEYEWPGNVRELYNVINYALNMADSRYVNMEHLPEFVQESRGHVKKGKRTGTLKELLRETEHEIIEETLRTYENSLHGKKQAAAALGVSLATLYNKIGAYSK